MNNFYTLKVDRVFKSLLLDNNNFEFLNRVLSDILEEEVKIETLEYVELPVINTNVKVQILDVLVKTRKNEYINIEVNINFNETIKERNLVYYMTEYVQRYKRGGKKTERVIQVNLNFTNNNQDELKEEIRIYNTTKNEIYYNEFYIVNVNLAKYKELWYDKNIKGNNEHIYLVTLAIDEKQELKNIRNNCKDNLVKEMCDKMFELNEDGTRTRLISVEKEQEILITRQLEEARQNGEKIGKEEGIKKGIKKGIKENSLDIAISLLKRGMSIKEVAEITHLSIKEVEKLKS